MDHNSLLQKQTEALQILRRAHNLTMHLLVFREGLRHGHIHQHLFTYRIYVLLFFNRTHSSKPRITRRSLIQALPDPDLLNFSKSAGSCAFKPYPGLFNLR